MSKGKPSIIPPGTDNLFVSSCLIGKKCCYDAKSRKCYSVIKFLKGKKFIDACPEMLASLGIPRDRIEISNCCGVGVLNGRARVINQKNDDLSQVLIESAYKILKLVKDNGIKYAIMKSHSPSCGVGEIYDGTFSHTLKDGDGVAAALLRKERIGLFTEKDFE